MFAGIFYLCLNELICTPLWVRVCVWKCAWGLASMRVCVCEGRAYVRTFCARQSQTWSRRLSDCRWRHVDWLTFAAFANAQPPTTGNMPPPSSLKLCCRCSSMYVSMYSCMCVWQPLPQPPLTCQAVSQALLLPPLPLLLLLLVLVFIVGWLQSALVAAPHDARNGNGDGYGDGCGCGERQAKPFSRQILYERCAHGGRHKRRRAK